MKAAERARLTAALRGHVGKVAEDLRGKMRAAGEVRERARKLHRDEQVGEDFEVWTDLLARRAAVLWVLKSVYVRVLEDRGLLSPGRILDGEAQQLFERLAPNLGETAFLRWVYRDLASAKGGLPELFSPQPAEIATPSDALSRELLEFWRHRDPDSGAHFSFAEEKFEGELMGDLYQELDPVVKDRFALCQTPDFVRAFMLDRTLSPAIETFGAEEVRLLDPACGSGHFLIDGLKRLCAATIEKRPEWDKKTVVAHCLARVVGIDLNDYACALARARLVMTAAELAGVRTLAEASQFHPHVYWADGLEQVEKGKDTRGEQLNLLDPSKNEAPRASLTRPEVRAVLHKVMAPGFHAVAANPPYIEEADRRRKNYQREKIGNRRRYQSAFKDYGLGALFTERAVQMLVKGGYLGVITANNFMKGESGKPLIDKVLSKVRLTLIVDTSGAILAPSGFETPTIMLFACNTRPDNTPVRIIVGKTGDVKRHVDHSKNSVWTSICQGWHEVGFENEFVAVVESNRDKLEKHPWAFQIGVADSILKKMEEHACGVLRTRVEPIGFASFAGLDEPFYQPKHVFRRLGYPAKLVRPLLTGQDVRDWQSSPQKESLTPYDDNHEPLTFNGELAQPSHLWRYRTALNSVSSFSGDRESEGADWWCWYRWIPERYRLHFRITFADVTTHNHFALDRGGRTFNNTAPIIRLKPGATEEDHLALLALLNSSTACFWFRRNAKKVGGRSSGTKRQSESWAQRLRFSGGLVERLPITDRHRSRLAELATRLDHLASELTGFFPRSVIFGEWRPESLQIDLENAQREANRTREMMVALQEELDWTVYAAYGIANSGELPAPDELEGLAPEHRPFAIRLARLAGVDEATYHWFEALELTPVVEAPGSYSLDQRHRIASRLSALSHADDLSFLESPEHKRKWEPLLYSNRTSEAALEWLTARIESVLEMRRSPCSLPQLVGAVQDDPKVVALAELYQSRRDVDLTGLCAQLLRDGTVPNHPFHLYTESGVKKRNAWERVWEVQRREDSGKSVNDSLDLPEYSQGSRGKSIDFLSTKFWKLRGKLDVPREAFVAFTEVPGREGADTLYGWAGWTPLERLRAILAIDEELEDGGLPLADRIALLDSAWRLLPDVAREDPKAASRLKAELQALVGPEGPSPELLEAWRHRFPPPKPRSRKNGPSARKSSPRKKRAVKKPKVKAGSEGDTR